MNNFDGIFNPSNINELKIDGIKNTQMLCLFSNIRSLELIISGDNFKDLQFLLHLKALVTLKLSLYSRNLN